MPMHSPDMVLSQGPVLEASCRHPVMKICPCDSLYLAPSLVVSYICKWIKLLFKHLDHLVHKFTAYIYKLMEKCFTSMLVYECVRLSAVTNFVSNNMIGLNGAAVLYLQHLTGMLQFLNDTQSGASIYM